MVILSRELLVHLQLGDDNMKPWERFSIVLLVCLTLLAAVWLHGMLNRYEVIPESGNPYRVTRYDHIAGRVWVMTLGRKLELGVANPEQ
jgi:hypothetical protein